MVTFRTLSAQETYQFRQAVLWPDKPLSHVMISGDETALHVGAFEGDALIGVGSFFLTPPKARLRKFAVSPKHQQKGVGSALLRHAAGLMRGQNIQQLWCDARQDACDFYRKRGFQIDPDVFLKSGVAYQRAQVALSQL